MPLDLPDKRASSDQPIAGGKPTSHLLIRGSGLDCRVGGGALARWPPSAAQTARATPCRGTLPDENRQPLVPPARCAASLQAFQTTLVVIGVSPLCQRLPGNSHALGLCRNPRQCSRRTSSSFGLSITSRSLRPLPPWT